jgi:3-hydroxyisobutyrate dehydrogenase
VLAPMGKNFFNCKKLSAGQIAKICNNAALGIQMFSLVESMAMGERLGIDMPTLNDIFMVMLI